MGGILWPISEPGREGMAGAGRPVAGGNGGALEPPLAGGPCIGTPRRGPPGEGGDNLTENIILNFSTNGYIKKKKT